ncbi:MAG: SLC13 family permease [Candidatus Woesearchaeota archaeon]
MNLETIALAIFVLTYLLIISEMIHETVAALIGALLMVIYRVVDYNTIGSLIDFKTLTVILGIFIIVNIVDKSGLFEFLALKLLKLTKGNPYKLLYGIAFLGFFISFIITEIPTTIILGTLIIKISKKLKISPIPYLIIIAMVVDIGGLLTPVSSIQNIMITTAVNIKFSEFTFFMLPLWLLIMISSMIFFRIYFRKDLSGEKITKEELQELLNLDEKEEIKDWKLFKRSAFLLTLIIIFFFLQDITGIGIDAVAITGAILMLLLSSANPDEILTKVEWSILAFFIGIFIVISGIEKVGLLAKFTAFISSYMHNTLSAILILMIITAFVSSIMNNIPLVALLIPIAKGITSTLGIQNNILFFGIATATCLGGNITPIGSPSNVLIIGMAQKEKHPISFNDFIKIGFRYTFLTLGIAFLYFAIRVLLKL